MTARRSLRRVSMIISHEVVERLLVFLTVLVLAVNTSGVAPPPSVKRVLLFYSSSLRAPFTGIQDEVIRQRLSSFGQLVEVFSDNLDPALEPDFYRRKYRDVHFDVIVSDRSEALTFLLSHRADVFGNSPVVFHTLNRENKVLDHLEPTVTGVEIDVSLLPSLNLIRQLQPDVKRVVVILGVDPSEVRFTRSSQSQTAPFDAEVPVDFWTGLTPDELRARLGSLPSHTAALYMTVQQDREGRALVSRNVLVEIAAASKAPIYSTFSTYLGLGTVGGRLMDPLREANITADFIEHILNGENVETLKPIILPARYAFDARELKRFHIAESRLPAGSEILFREHSAWTHYRYYILCTLFLLIVESGLVALLLAERRRGNRSRQLLERRFAIEQVISEHSTKLSDCAADQVNVEIDNGLQELLAVEGADRASWFVIPDPGSEVGHVCSAHRSGVSAEVAFYDRPELPWSTEILLRGEPVVVSDLDLLPREAECDKRYFAQRGVKSVALVPSSSGTAARGVLLLVCLDNTREWPASLISRLGVLGNIFANAAMRQLAQEATQESEQRFRYLFEEAPFGIAIEDVDGQLLFANPALASMLGYTAEELCGTKCAEFADNEDEKDDWRHFQEMRNGLRQSYQIEKRYTRKDGVRVWGRLNVSLLKGSAQKPPMVFATVEDITERKAKEKELQLVHGEVQNLTARLLQAQEEEKQRIARELHDDIGQRLSLFMMELDLLQTELPVDRTSEQAKIHNLLTQLNELVSDIHGMSHQLHSAKLQHLGLTVALKDVCRQVSSQHHIAVELQADDVPRSVPSPVSLCFYRVAQEALNNAAKHSRSPRIEVRLVNEESQLRMQIKDFGIGFDPSALSNGIGMVTMQERMRAIGGRLLINSRPGIGTEVSAEANVEQLPVSAKVA